MIDYTAEENAIWRTVCRELAPKHARYAVREYREAVERVGLPRDRVPQLDEVTARVEPLGGWHYVPAAGLVPLREFYGSLESRTFHSTQYLRHPAVPLYTPEPDIIHEVIGHGHLLATPTFGELHRLAGVATNRLRDDDNVAFLSRVFWFSLEFGVVVEDGELRAYGAGILSSYGEIDEFRSMEHRPLDIAEMGTGRVRHHPLPAGALPGRVGRGGRRDGRRVLRDLHGRLDRGAARTSPRRWRDDAGRAHPPPALATTCR